MGIPLFTSATSPLKYASEGCVTSLEHEGKDNVRQKFSFSTHHMIDDVVAKPLWCISINTSCFPQKTGARTFATECEGNSDTCHQGYVVTWQHVLRLRWNQALICRLVVQKDGNHRHHVIIEINHGCVCVFDINPLVCCLTVGRNNTLRSCCQKHTLRCWVTWGLDGSVVSNIRVIRSL